MLVGQLYSRNDIRRDPAFSIFYMAINTGAWLGLIVIGILGETVGWSYGFGAAEIGMLIGLGIFILFRRELQGAGMPPAPVRASDGRVSGEAWIYLGAIIAVGTVWYLIRSQGAVGVLLVAFSVLTVAHIVYRSV